MPLKEEGSQYELLQDIINTIIHEVMLQDLPLIEPHELSHISYDQKKDKYFCN